MPLSSKEEEVKEKFEREYGSEKGEEVYFASRNKGVVPGGPCDQDAVQLSGGNVGGLMEQPIPERSSGGLSGIDSICGDFDKRFK
jgi:hypothetical protein